MGDWYHLNPDGSVTPIGDVLSAVRRGISIRQSDAERRIGRTVVTDGVEVSTVFLGFDHSWGDGPPLLFETMVFGGPLDEEYERYSTKHEAVQGHELMVERVRAALDAPPPTEP